MRLLEHAFSVTGEPGFGAAMTSMDWCYLPVKTVVHQLAKCYNQDLDLFYLTRFCSRVLMLPSLFKVPQMADKWECLGMMTGPPYSGKSTVAAACLHYYVKAPAASRGLSQYVACKSSTLEDHYQLTKVNSQRLVLGPDEAALLLSSTGDSKRWSFQDIINLVCAPVLGSSSSKIDRAMKHHRVGGLVPCANLKYSQDVFDCGAYRRTMDCVIDPGMGPRTKDETARRYLKCNKDSLWAVEQALVEQQLMHFAVTTGVADTVDDELAALAPSAKKTRTSSSSASTSIAGRGQSHPVGSVAQAFPQPLAMLAEVAGVRNVPGTPGCATSDGASPKTTSPAAKACADKKPPWCITGTVTPP